MDKNLLSIFDHQIIVQISKLMPHTEWRNLIDAEAFCRMERPMKSIMSWFKFKACWIHLQTFPKRGGICLLQYLLGVAPAVISCWYIRRSEGRSGRCLQPLREYPPRMFHRCRDQVLAQTVLLSDGLTEHSEQWQFGLFLGVIFWNHNKPFSPMSYQRIT